MASNLAISVACVASVVGGIVGSLALLTISPYLAGVAKAFGQKLILHPGAERILRERIKQMGGEVTEARDG